MPSGPGSSALATYLHHGSLSNTLMPSPATQHLVPGPYTWGLASGWGGGQLPGDFPLIPSPGLSNMTTLLPASVERDFVNPNQTRTLVWQGHNRRGHAAHNVIAWIAAPASCILSPCEGS